LHSFPQSTPKLSRVKSPEHEGDPFTTWRAVEYTERGRNRSTRTRSIIIMIMVKEVEKGVLKQIVVCVSAFPHDSSIQRNENKPKEIVTSYICKSLYMRIRFSMARVKTLAGFSEVLTFSAIL
jgi:hypothetical protein